MTIDFDDDIKSSLIESMLYILVKKVIIPTMIRINLEAICTSMKHEPKKQLLFPIIEIRKTKRMIYSSCKQIDMDIYEYVEMFCNVKHQSGFNN